MSVVPFPAGGRDVQRLRRTIDELRDQIAPLATDSEFAYFTEVCVRLDLAPVGEQIYLIGPRWDARLRRKVHKVHIGVAGRRVLAERTGMLWSVEGPMWCGPRAHPDAPLVWEEVWTGEGYPYAARTLVTRKDRDRTKPHNGTCKWSSFAQRDNQGNLLPTWEQMPDHMLGKDSESLALKRAFAEVIPNDLDVPVFDDDRSLWVPPQAELEDPSQAELAGGGLRAELADRLASVNHERGPAATDELRRRWVQLFAPEPAPAVRAGPYSMAAAMELDDWLREVEGPDEAPYDDPDAPPADDPPPDDDELG